MDHEKSVRLNALITRLTKAANQSVRHPKVEDCLPADARNAGFATPLPKGDFTAGWYQAQPPVA